MDKKNKDGPGGLRGVVPYDKIRCHNDLHCQDGKTNNRGEYQGDEMLRESSRFDRFRSVLAPPVVAVLTDQAIPNDLQELVRDVEISGQAIKTFCFIQSLY